MGYTQPWYWVRGVDAPVGGEMGHIVCFLRDGDRVFLTYSTTGRGNEPVNGSLGLLDMTPYGRREAWEDNPEGWPEAPQADSPVGGHGSPICWYWRSAIASSIACEHFGSRLSSTRESAGKMTTESRPAAISAAALAGVTTFQRRGPTAVAATMKGIDVACMSSGDGHALARGTTRAIEQRRQPAHDQQRREEERGRAAAASRCGRCRASRSYLTPVVTKKIGMNIPKLGGLELAPEVGVGHGSGRGRRAR